MKLVLSIFMVSLTHIAIASGSLKGVIIDRDKGIPLVGVNVIVEGTKIGTSTNEEGEFTISGIIPGNYTLMFSMVGYEQKSKKIKISDKKTVELEISLSAVTLQLPDVTVTGQTVRDLLEMPQTESVGLELSTSTISRQEIRRQGSKTVIDALNFVPGALIETRGRKVKQFFSVRGQKYPYPEYSINGVWQREFLETSYHYPTTNIERIEVLRSSAALLTGINGMAGIVNIIPREYDSSETSFSLEYGTFGTFRSTISNGAKIGDLSYATGIGIEHTDGPSGMHAKEDMMSFNGNLKWTPAPKLTIRYYLFHNSGKRELRLAEPPAASRFLNELGSYDPVRSTLTNLKVDYKFSQNSNTAFLIYYTERNPVYIYEDSITHEITRFPERDWEWGLNLIHSMELSEKNTLRLGALYNHWIAPNGKRYYYGKKNDLESVALVAVDEQNFGALNLDIGLRYVHTYINQYGGFGINGSGKGFGEVDPLRDKWQSPVMQANLGASYALPRLYTLNFNVTFGEIKPLPGSLDTNLEVPRNETRIKLDVGLRKSWHSIGQFSMVGFSVHQIDAIALSGETFESPGRYMELYVNRDQRQYGLEIEGRSAKLWNSLEIFFNTTLMNSVSEQGGEMSKNLELPQIISAGGLYYQGSHFEINLLPKYVSSFESTRFAAKGLPPQALGDYLTLDAILGWTLQGKSNTTRLFLEGKNLSDIHYSTVVGYPDFGRTITIGIHHIIG